jgi:putative NIF3 family GTP cyclohydrolase 1 type 2
MKLKKLFDFIVAEGLKVDPRPQATINDVLERRKQAYAALSDAQKKFFNKESLVHPFDDSRLLFGDPDTEIKTAMVGIDIDAGELLTIEQLNAKNKTKIDLAISHHPQGLGFAALNDVMHMQADIFHYAGVPINIAEGLVDERQKEVGRRLHAANHYRAADIAGLLGIPFLCMHTPADNHAVSFLQNHFDAKKPRTLKDILDFLLLQEEYQVSSREQVPPTILFGKPGNRTGKILIDMTGGTEGPKDMIDHLVAAGVGTILGMHMSEEHYKKMQGKHINVIIAGHIASDNLGINLLCDKIEKKGAIKFMTCSGFRRVRR